jgi:hypothetical protein
MNYIKFEIQKQELERERGKRRINPRSNSIGSGYIYNKIIKGRGYKEISNN